MHGINPHVYRRAFEFQNSGCVDVLNYGSYDCGVLHFGDTEGSVVLPFTSKAEMI
ncbi:hypothetical protein V7S43_011635 [Phytophthora oleae]|uniref:Uncharacterized protein n=1 Tax=Phytophthora oleae TaxID=2107226 RepID=A0ABD3FA86_9STRA